MPEFPSIKSQTAIVTGGSRGLGRGVVQALTAKGLNVVVLARDSEGLTVLTRELANIDPVVGDAADELTAGRLLQERQPDLVVLCAGASALLCPLHHHSWETFSQNWEVDAPSNVALGTLQHHTVPTNKGNRINSHRLAPSGIR